MQLSKYSIRKLAKLINGDTDQFPYMSGPELVDFFNQFGFRDLYGDGFPSRWVYVENKLLEKNGDQSLATIIEESVNPVRFFDTEYDIENAVEHLNELLIHDNYQLTKSGKGYKIVNHEGVYLEPESLAEIENDFLTEQILKCDNKILNEDFDGAITNSRTLIETVMLDILNAYEVKYDHKGDLLKAYSEIKKVMNLNPGDDRFPDSIKQLLSGLNSIINGLATLRNEMGDAHTVRYKAKKHHAKLAVNSAKTIGEFLIESFNKQSKD